MVIISMSAEYLFGEFVPALGVLMVLTVVDILTGITKGIVDRSLISRKMSHGMIVKAMMFVVILVANMLDMAYTPGVPVFRTGVILFYVYMETISIFENLGQMGVAIPEFLRKRLEVLGENTKEGRTYVDISNERR